MNNNTTQRSIRIPDDLWHQVQSQAAQDHINVSALIRGLLRGWLDQDNEGGEMSIADRAQRVEKVSELVAAIEEIILDKVGANVLRSGMDGSFTLAGGTVARMIDAALTEASK